MSRVSGTILEEETRIGITDAVIKMTARDKSSHFTVSGEGGAFLFEDLPPGDLTVEVFKEGYQPKKRKLEKRSGSAIILSPGKFLHLNPTSFSELSQVAGFLSGKNRADLGLDIQVFVYVQDPLVAHQVKVEKTQLAKLDEWEPIQSIDVTCEPRMMDGPTSSRIAVVDFDADANKLAPAVQWDETNRFFYFMSDEKKVRLTKEHQDLYPFHQVNVWAIVQSILHMYEQPGILGRPAPWAFEGNRIILVPHAGMTRNAFYDRKSKSIQFYYFDSGPKRVFTCLSHDIIAHETGHAVLDGLRPFYLEDTSLQTTAFHEFAADLTAIMAALQNNDLRWQVVKESGGELSKDTVLSSLAEEFGYYSYGRPYLRTAQNEKTVASVQGNFSPYEWSQVLTGAMFEILSRMVDIRLAKSLKNEAKPTPKQAYNFVKERFRRVAFQPLDYLAPVDVQFDDYARAVLRADELVEPSDEDGYRLAMKDVFTRRGINFEEGIDPRSINFYGYDINRIARSKTDAYHFVNDNRYQLCIPPEQDIAIVDLYQTDKAVWGVGRLPREIVVQYVWREDVRLEATEFDRLQNEYISLLCGGTLVFDSRGNLLSWQHKPGTEKMAENIHKRPYCEEERAKGNKRKEDLLAYLKDRLAVGAIGLEGSGRTNEVELQGPIAAARDSDGRLRFQVTPHLRHWSEKI